MNNTFLYIITVLIWGTTWFCIKSQIGQAPIEASIIYRQILASIFLISWCFIRKIKLNIFTAKDHFFLSILGVSMFSAHFLFIYGAANYVASGIIAVVFSTVSFFNIFYNVLFFKSLPKMNIILGVFFGIMGLGIFFSPVFMNIELQETALKGIGLATIGAFIFSLGSVVTQRNQARGLDTVPCITVASIYGVLFTLIYGIFSGVDLFLPKSALYWASSFYLSFFGTVIAGFCYLSLVRNIGSALAGYATILYPLIALIISSIFEGYTWGFANFLGLSLVVLGNIAVMWKKDK